MQEDIVRGLQRIESNHENDRLFWHEAWASLGLVICSGNIGLTQQVGYDIHQGLTLYSPIL